MAPRNETSVPLLSDVAPRDVVNLVKRYVPRGGLVLVPPRKPNPTNAEREKAREAIWRAYCRIGSIRETARVCGCSRDRVRGVITWHRDKAQGDAEAAHDD